MYIVLKKVPECHRYPLYFEKKQKSSRFRHTDSRVVVSTHADSTENSDACWLFADEAVFIVQSFMLLAGQISEYRRIHPLF